MTSSHCRLIIYSITIAADTIINVLNTRINRQVDAIKRAIEDGFHLVKVVGDSACLFRAVCLSDSVSEDNHLALRATVVDYMRNNAEEYAPYGSLDPMRTFDRFDKYLERISRPSQEVGEFVLRALARVLNKRINLCYADYSPRCYLPMICSNADFVRLQHVNILHNNLLGSNSGYYMALVQDPTVTDAGADVKSGHNANNSSINAPLNRHRGNF